jgi:hypothetical protein
MLRSGGAFPTTTILPSASISRSLIVIPDCEANVGSIDPSLFKRTPFSGSPAPEKAPPAIILPSAWISMSRIALPAETTKGVKLASSEPSEFRRLIPG